LAVVMGFQALADFVSGQGLGATAAVPWGISVWGEVRHPVQLYELGLWVLGALLIWRAGRASPAPGTLFMLFLATYGVALLLVEPFRAQSTLILGGIRAEQLAGLLALLAALWLMRAWWVRSAGSTSQGRDGAA
jgi:phosphatidylglycerol:prolipoprotein diacylglycerol transferase